MPMIAPTNFGTARAVCGLSVRANAMAAMLALAAFSLAVDAAAAGCAGLRASRSSLPDATVCPRQAGVAANIRSGDALISALYARADEQIKAGRFEQAKRTLDCAEAQLGDHPDGPLRYELVHRRGVLAYRQEQIAQALGGFECALSMARANDDRELIARELKNIGSALRRLGDYRGALRALTTSLDLQRSAADGATGAVLNNIADVYRELEDPEQAIRFYRDALAAFRRRGDRIEAAHVLESMSALALDRGDATAAKPWLEDALDAYRQAGTRPYQLRVYAQLARASLVDGDIASARASATAGLALAAQHDLPVPAALELQAARAERLSDRPDAARARLEAAIARLSADDADRADLLAELASVREAVGDRDGAIATLRQAHAAERAIADARQNRELGWLRSRFEATERERTIAELEHENRLRSAMLRQRTLTLWLTVAIALVGVLGLLLLFHKRQQRARLVEAARQARHEEELARYRREADELQIDRTVLKALLGTRPDAVCVIDVHGLVLTANRRACELLRAEEGELIGHTFAEQMTETARPAFSTMLEGMEDAASLQLDFVPAHGGAALRAQLAEWERDGGLIVMTLCVAADRQNEPVAEARAIAETAPGADEDAGPTRMDDGELQLAFRRALVELMLAVVEVWERTSGKGRLELAEQSRVWRVTVDDGRLRARAMERYLSLSKLPRQPRWRDVLRSAYFVLAQCAMDAPTRSDLQQRVDAVLAYTRRSALV
ncbi:MAG: tetratricopeptide repeat protein [Lysobacteraceae bacterium]|nr:MAG: tetratricopeptide repeat protein [Xanthomonadaceae bacterium]